jgi:hypothetical protein
MSLVRLAYQHLTEWSTITLSGFTADAVYPSARLCDRNIARKWQGATYNGTDNRIIVNQAAVGSGCAFMAIPAGHNLSGATLTVQRSSNGTDWTTATGHTGWTQSGSGQIIKEWTSEVYQYWSLRVQTPTSAPHLAELFFSPTPYTFERNPARPWSPTEKRHPVATEELSGGQRRTYIMGSGKRLRNYQLAGVSAAARTALESFNDTTCGGAKAFWMCDHEGVWIPGILTEPLELTEVAYQRNEGSFIFEEILP